VILKAIQQVGDESLKAVYEHLQESCAYEDIRLVRAWWRQQQS
jgi:ATP-dependent DNA helicase RecQ